MPDTSRDPLAVMAAVLVPISPDPTRDAAAILAELARHGLAVVPASDLTPLWNRLRPNSTDTAEDMRRDMMHARAIVERMLAASQDAPR